MADEATVSVHRIGSLPSLVLFFPGQQLPGTITPIRLDRKSILTRWHLHGVRRRVSQGHKGGISRLFCGPRHDRRRGRYGGVGCVPWTPEMAASVETLHHPHISIAISLAAPALGIVGPLPLMGTLMVAGRRFSFSSSGTSPPCVFFAISSIEVGGGRLAGTAVLRPPFWKRRPPDARPFKKGFTTRFR